MSTAEKREYFNQGPSGNAYKKFNRENIPDEAMYKKLFKSLLFWKNVEDTAKVTRPGHVMAATDQDVISRKTPTQYGDGHTRIVQPHQIPVPTTEAMGSDFEYAIFVDSVRGEDTIEEDRGQTQKPYKTLIAARDRAGGYYIKGTPTTGSAVITGILAIELANAKIGDLVTFGGGANNINNIFSSPIANFDAKAGTITLENVWGIDDSLDNYSFRVIPEEGLKRLIIVMPGDYTFGEDEKYMQYANYDFGGAGLCRAGLDWYFHKGANITIEDTNQTPLFSNEYTYSYYTDPINEPLNKVTVSGGTNIYGQVSIDNQSDIPVYKGVRNVGSKEFGENREIFQFNEEGNVFEFHKITSVCNTADILIDLIPSNIYPISAYSPMCLDEFGDPITFWGQSELLENNSTRNDNIFFIRGNYMSNTTGICIEVYEAVVDVEIGAVTSNLTVGCIFDGTAGKVKINRLSGLATIADNPSIGQFYNITGKFYGFDLVVDVAQGFQINSGSKFIAVRGIRENVHTDEHEQGRVTVYGNEQNIIVDGGIVNISGTIACLQVIQGEFFEDLPVGIGYDAPDVHVEWLTGPFNVFCSRATVTINRYGFKDENFQTFPYQYHFYSTISNPIADDGSVVTIKHAQIQSIRQTIIVRDNSTLIIDFAIAMSVGVACIQGYDTCEIFVNHLSVNGITSYRYALPDPGTYPLVMPTNCDNLADKAALGAAMNKNYYTPRSYAVDMLDTSVLHLGMAVSNDKTRGILRLASGTKVFFNASILCLDAGVGTPPIQAALDSYVIVLAGGVSMNFFNDPPTYWYSAATLINLAAASQIIQDSRVYLKMKSI